MLMRIIRKMKKIQLMHWWMLGFCIIYGILGDCYSKVYLEILPIFLRIKNKNLAQLWTKFSTIWLDSTSAPIVGRFKSQTKWSSDQSKSPSYQLHKCETIKWKGNKVSKIEIVKVVKVTVITFVRPHASNINIFVCVV